MNLSKIILTPPWRQGRTLVRVFRVTLPVPNLDKVREVPFLEANTGDLRTYVWLPAI